MERPIVVTILPSPRGGRDGAHQHQLAGLAGGGVMEQREVEFAPL